MGKCVSFNVKVAPSPLPPKILTETIPGILVIIRVSDPASAPPPPPPVKSKLRRTYQSLFRYA